MSDQNTSLPIRTQTNGDVVAKLVDGATNTQYLNIDAAGLIGSKLHDGAGTAVTSQVNGAQQALDVGINVAGAQIDPRDIRALTATDVVTAKQGDGAATHANPWWVHITDGTNDAAITAAGELQVSVTQPLPAGANLIGSVNARTEDGAGTAITSTLINSKQSLDVDLSSEGTSGTAAPYGTIQVGGSDGTNLRTLATFATGILKAGIFDSSGNAISTMNPLPVTVDTVAGTTIDHYKDASSIAAAATDDHDYTVTAGKTLYLTQIEASASGKAKMEVKVETAVGSGTFTSKFVQFNSTADTNMSIRLEDPIAVAAGVKVRVTMTNRDISAQDLYSTICGHES